METHDLTEIDCDARPVPGLGVVVHLRVPESEQQGRLHLRDFVVHAVVIQALS